MPAFNYYSPLGLIKIAATNDGINSILFWGEGDDDFEQQTNNHIDSCIQQLDEYFNSQRRAFDLKLNFEGTEFQKRVWNELLNIPFGKTTNYLQLAKNLGDPKCIRAAASANGKNPFAIVVPCHRVIGSDNTLVGYAGGLMRKQWLLNHESKQLALF